MTSQKKATGVAYDFQKIGSAVTPLPGVSSAWQQSYQSEKIYIWHLLKTVQLPRESFGLFPLYPVGSSVLQGDLDKGDMLET